MPLGAAEERLRRKLSMTVLLAVFKRNTPDIVIIIQYLTGIVSVSLAQQKRPGECLAFFVVLIPAATRLPQEQVPAGGRARLG